MNRRDFLKGAGAAAIVPAAIPGAIWGSSSPPAGESTAAASATPESTTSPRVAPITAVVYDERYADCRLFAAALVRHGAVAFPANADSAQLWYGSLRAHLASRAGRVAGLTTYADFTISQACGRELDLATLYEGAHDARRSHSNLTHRLRVSGDAPDIAAAIARPDASWAESLANALCCFPSARDSAVRNASTVSTPRATGHPGYLASWLLAPSAVS
jgi:hypothetical protein